MFMFCAFMVFGLYHIYVVNPAAFNTIKMMAIFGLIQAQMFVEYSLNEGKKYFHICEKYVKKNIIPRENIFSNEHILECYAISYCLDRDDSKPAKIPYKFSKSVVDEGRIINKDTMFVTEIKFDNLESVRLVDSSNHTFYPMQPKHRMIDSGYSVGYPTRVKCPFICVEVIYEDIRYDITGLLKEYLYPGNVILSKQFIRMLMFEHLGLYIKPNTSFSLHTVDHEIKINVVHFNAGDDNCYSREL
jgi:hypothetical protein